MKIPVAIIGCGPAGAAAAIQLRREGIDCRIFADDPGGCIRNAGLIENLPGYPRGVPGSELADSIQKQLEYLQIATEPVHVSRIEFAGDYFAIQTSRWTLRAAFAVVATGTRPKRLYLPGEEDAHSAGRLAYDICTCKNRIDAKEILIVGGGDVAYDYALQLWPLARSVTLLLRSDTASALPALQRRLSEDRIRVLTGRTIAEIAHDDQKVFISTAESETFSADLALVAIGREPNLDLLPDALSPPNAIPNLFLAGDAAHPYHRHIALAFADGLRAALDITVSISRVDS
jgi:thioredoxin reductase (NADPH)